jgi:hypothetical protein
MDWLRGKFRLWLSASQARLRPRKARPSAAPMINGAAGVRSGAAAIALSESLWSCSPFRRRGRVEERVGVVPGKVLQKGR